MTEYVWSCSQIQLIYILKKNTYISKLQIDSIIVDKASDALSAFSDALLRTTSGERKSEKKKALQKKKKMTSLKFDLSKEKPKINCVEEVCAESKTVRYVPTSCRFGRVRWIHTHTHTHRTCANPPKIPKHQGEIPNRKLPKKKKNRQKRAKK